MFITNPRARAKAPRPASRCCCARGPRAPRRSGRPRWPRPRAATRAARQGPPSRSNVGQRAVSMKLFLGDAPDVGRAIILDLVSAACREHLGRLTRPWRPPPPRAPRPGRRRRTSNSADGEGASAAADDDNMALGFLTRRRCAHRRPWVGHRILQRAPTDPTGPKRLPRLTRPAMLKTTALCPDNPQNRLFPGQLSELSPVSGQAVLSGR